MNTVVCIKEVFDSDDVKINKETKNIDRSSAELFINPYDLNAIELALELKEKHGGETYVMTMGVPSAEGTLRECLARGIDKAILITDRDLAGSDAVATSLALTETIKKYVPDVDLILCGKHAIDAETSIIGPGIAQRLDVPQLTYVNEVIEVDDKKVVARRIGEDEDLVVETTLPAVMTVSGEINKPRYMSLNNIRYAVNEEIQMVNLEKLGLEKERVGVEGSPTIVGEMHMVEKSGDCNILSGNPQEIAKQLAEMVLKYN